MEIIYNNIKNLSDIKDNLDAEINAFYDLFTPLESTLYVLQDNVTNAIFCECHILADKFIQYGTKDVPLDPEEQPEYRANRELVEDNIAFLQMKSDALHGRNFSNIVTEYTTNFDSEHPLKIIGGQHRFEAISEAFSTSLINVYQGIKVYFCLDIEQRLDVQLISNTNIAVSSDLLDRMMETVKGPQLRNWCQEVSLLAPNSDFSDKKQRGNSITVREARTFILNYFNGKDLCDSPFDQTKTQCVLAKTGGIDNDWENLKINTPNLWNDTLLKEAGKQFALLAQKQNEFYTENSKKTNKEFADKAYNYAILASWAYVAGILSNNTVRLTRHYNLPINSKKDPLNAEALAKAKHKSDPINYRGLGSRTDVKERGRLVELFYLQAEKGAGITKPLIDLALTKYFAKQANLEVLEAEKKNTMTNNFDEFTNTLFNEAKFLLEKAKSFAKNPSIESSYLHSSLLLGMSALEAYVNGISLELIEGGFDLNLNEKALISERDILFDKGTFQLGTKLKMQRLIDRIDFIYCKYSNKSISSHDTWNQNIKQTIKLRNDLVHPKTELVITYSQVESALQNILQTIDVLYKAVYKTHVPILNYGLLSTLTE